jgi:putative oxidoreductase
MAMALLIARLAIGLGMAVHGAQKLFGWFGGYGLAGTGGFFDTMGFRPGRVFAFLAGAAEVGSGLLVALGLLGPIGPALMILVMIVAIFSAHWKQGFLAANNGFEIPMLYGAGALALAFSGPGAYSVDTLLGVPGRWTAPSIWVLVGGAVVAAAANLVVRRVQAG